MKHHIATPAGLALALLIQAGIAGTAAAQTRWVFVNGVRMSDVQVMEMARAHCRPIPNGSYWWNPDTGAWGFAGNPAVKGFVGDRCGTAPRQPSLSERDRLYRPGEILNGR
jgi:hypothetical protein